MGGLIKQITGNNDMKGEKYWRRKSELAVLDKKQKHKRKDQWAGYSESGSNQKEERRSVKKL